MVLKLWRARDGNFSMMLALMLPMLLGAVGLAVDIATLSKAHSKLQNALDSAVLAASRINDKTIEREQVFQDFLRANLVTEPSLTNVVASITIDTGLNYINTTGTAAADVDLNFAFLFGTKKKVSASASAYESRNNLEVVLALDNTGSMGAYRMGELRKAATSLVNILETVHSPDVEPKRVVKAALVPFVTAVNVKGEGYKSSWIDGLWDGSAGKYVMHGTKHHGVNFNYKSGTKRYSHMELFAELDIAWKGCVEARAAPYNMTDDAPDPDNPDTLFVPYFAPDEPGNAKTPPDSSTAYNNSYLDDKVSGTERQKQQSVTKYTGYNGSGSVILNAHASTTSGPNYACPTPIVPLTSDFDKLKTEIGKMIHWYGSGTNVSEGLAWGMRVLSPDEPYTQGAPFKSENNSKFVVVFTDGENNVFGASSQAINKSDYGSYSFVDQGRMATDRGKALTQVNTWTLEVCENLKDNDVEIFTVLLGADTKANRTLYTACATTPDHYYPTSDVSQLDLVFKKIASRIAKLYVTG